MYRFHALICSFASVLVLCYSLTLPRCGTGTGTPTFDTPGETKEGPITIGLADCGSYTQDSLPVDIAAGQQCMRDALTNCVGAEYLIEKENNLGQRFNSVVWTTITSESPLDCEVNIITVSDDPSSGFVGEAEATCTDLPNTVQIELACGIGDGNGSNVP